MQMGEVAKYSTHFMFTHSVPSLSVMAQYSIKMFLIWNHKSCIAGQKMSMQSVRNILGSYMSYIIYLRPAVALFQN